MHTTWVRQQQVPRPLPRVRAAFSSFSPFHPTLAPFFWRLLKKANKWKLVVLIQVVSIQTQAVKLHKNFITSSIICTWTKKKTFRANLQLDWINLYQNNFVSKQPETLTNMTWYTFLLVWECDLKDLHSASLSLPTILLFQYILPLPRAKSSNNNSAARCSNLLNFIFYKFNTYLANYFIESHVVNVLFLFYQLQKVVNLLEIK